MRPPWHCGQYKRNRSVACWLAVLILVTPQVAVYARSTRSVSGPDLPEYPDVIDCGDSEYAAGKYGRPTLEACRHAIAELPDSGDQRPWFWYNEVSRRMRHGAGPSMNLPYKDCPVIYGNFGKLFVFTLLLTFIRP